MLLKNKEKSENLINQKYVKLLKAIDKIHKINIILYYKSRNKLLRNKFLNYIKQYIINFILFVILIKILYIYLLIFKYYIQYPNIRLYKYLFQVYYLFIFYLIYFRISYI